MTKTLHSVKFLFMGPVILLFLFAINMLTWSGHWWIQWPALGIGIAWLIRAPYMSDAISLHHAV